MQSDPHVDEEMRKSRLEKAASKVFNALRTDFVAQLNKEFLGGAPSGGAPGEAEVDHSPPEAPAGPGFRDDDFLLAKSGGDEDESVLDVQAVQFAEARKKQKTAVVMASLEGSCEEDNLMEVEACLQQEDPSGEGEVTVLTKQCTKKCALKLKVNTLQGFVVLKVRLYWRVSVGDIAVQFQNRVSGGCSFLFHEIAAKGKDFVRKLMGAENVRGYGVEGGTGDDRSTVSRVPAPVAEEGDDVPPPMPRP